jgi:tRNA A-37 threonylcarbamoyl transferase component Bud32
VSAAAQHSAANLLFDADVPPNEETCYALAGHSGARVVLHARPAFSFVRKTAAARSHNDRLLGQIAKQRDLGRAGIAFPRILASGFDDEGCAFFDMAYIPGRTLADAVMNSTAFASETVLAAVEKMLWLFQACRGAALPAEQFRAKIGTIANNAVPSDAVRICAERLLRLDWDGIPHSPSHGDLTLENIMFGAERNVVFIDCDQAWVSSYWLDAGKLFQDFYGHWCLRRLYPFAELSVQRANAIGKLTQLAVPFRALVERQDRGLAGRLHQLAALNLFRALPYATEPDTAAFICARISRILEG